MLRPAVVLVALSGCDMAWGLEHIDKTDAPCGPFFNVREVPIVGVTEPRQFSISEDETLALVHGTDAMNKKRPIPLQWNGEAWEPHAMYQAGFDTVVTYGARLAPSEEIPDGSGAYVGPVQPAMHAWITNTSRLQVNRYYWTGTTWTSDNREGPVYNAPDFDSVAGNVILVRNAVGADRVRHTVITKIAAVDTDTNQIVLHANNLPEYTLVEKPARTAALNEEAAAVGVKLGDAVLTANQATLVYAGVSGGQSDLFASAQSPLREFATGGEIIGIDTNNDEVEPWINATCSKLYFRRIPAGSPNDPGQIFVAE